MKIFFHSAANCKLKTTLKISAWKFYISFYGASRFDRDTELKVEEGEHSSGVPPEADAQFKYKLHYGSIFPIYCSINEIKHTHLSGRRAHRHRLHFLRIASLYF